MTVNTRCAARQYSDQMHCQVCRLTWDTNDDPPACGRAEAPPPPVRREPVLPLVATQPRLAFASGLRRF